MIGSGSCPGWSVQIGLSGQFSASCKGDDIEAPQSLAANSNGANGVGRCILTLEKVGGHNEKQSMMIFPPQSSSI